MSSENPIWGGPRLQLELRLLGHDLAEGTITKYMTRRRSPGCGQRWFTFLRNHARQIAVCDLFVVPTATFRLLYVFVVLSHDRRKILHCAVTPHPTDLWLAEQIQSAFAGSLSPPRFLLRDRDASYGRTFAEALAQLGIKTLRSSPRSPWQNAFVERVIGSIRSECLNHLIVLSAAGLRVILDEYVAYYNSGRAHQSLNGRPPDAQPHGPQVELWRGASLADCTTSIRELLRRQNQSRRKYSAEEVRPSTERLLDLPSVFRRRATIQHVPTRI